MTILIICTLIFILLALIMILTVSTYNNIQCYVIRINEAENNIDAILRQRFDLLNKSIDIIKAHIKTDDEVLGTVVKLRSKKLSNFELDRQIYEGIKEFNKFKEEYPELKKSEVFTRTDISLGESEAEIIAFRKYYNDIITDYNKIVKSFPANIVALLSNQKTKPYFDGNNLNENNKVKL